MIYILFVFIAAISTLAVGAICAKKGVLEVGGKIDLHSQLPEDEEIIPFKGWKLVALAIGFFVCAIVIQLSLHANTSVINFAKLYGLFLIVFSAAVIDAKRRIIPNVLILIGLGFRVAIYCCELFLDVDMKSVLINDAIGLCIGFVFLTVVSFLSKGSLGFGDAKLFGVIGIISGSFCTYSTLFVSLILSAVFSIINIARKKMGRKDSFPFGPCIAAGYILVILLTSY